MKKGWEIKALGDICTFRPPKSEARDRLGANDPVSFVPMSELGINQKYFLATETTPLSKVAGSYTYFADGDVLLAKITPCFENGKLGVADGLTNGVGFGSSEFFVIRPGHALDKDFLYYFLSQPAVRQEGQRCMGGAVGQQRVPKEYLESLTIPVPPLPEQRRIVAILDEAFEGIAGAKANAETNLQNADDLFESYCEQSLRRGPEGWEEKPLGELCEIKHGFAFKSKYFVNDGEYVCLTPGNFLESGGYRDRGEKTKYYSGPIPEGFVLSPGQMLLAMTEQAPGLLGSPIIVPKGQRFLHNQRLGLVCPKAGVPLETGFFFHVFNGRCFRHAVHASATGVKVRHTSPAKLGNIKVAFPTSSRQQRGIASAINAFQSEAEAVATACNNKTSALDELKASLLHQAFSGDL